MVGNPLLLFVVVAVLCGLGLWIISQFPIDATIYKFIRGAIIVVLAVMLLNLILVTLFHHSLSQVIGGS